LPFASTITWNGHVEGAPTLAKLPDPYGPWTFSHWLYQRPPFAPTVGSSFQALNVKPLQSGPSPPLLPSLDCVSPSSGVSSRLLLFQHPPPHS
jgi:hypothetical protein